MIIRHTFGVTMMEGLFEYASHTSYLNVSQFMSFHASFIVGSSYQNTFRRPALNNNKYLSIYSVLLNAACVKCQRSNKNII